MILFRKISFWLSLLGLISAGSLVLQLRAQLNEPAPPPPLAPPARPFAQGGIGAAGIVEASGENTRVGVPVPGLVDEVFVKVWDDVKAGDPLLRLDTRDLDAQLPVLRAKIQVSLASIAALETQQTRAKKLTQSGAAAEENLDTINDNLRIARAELEASQASLEQTEKLIERMTIRAPIDGTVLQLNIRKGEYVANASTASLVIGDISFVQVRADVDEQVAPRVKPGKPAIGYLKGDTSHPIALEFVRIEPYIIPKVSLTGAPTERVDTRVLQVIYRFPRNTGHPVYVGQQLDLYIEE